MSYHRTLKDHLAIEPNKPPLLPPPAPAVTAPPPKTAAATTTTTILTPPVISILLTETAERFSYYGFRAILVLYFTQALHFAPATAVASFAYVTSLSYFTCLIGAVVADAFWGRFLTIAVFGCFYGAGLILLTVAAAKGEDGGGRLWLTWVGLFLT
eukprot:CAMPEP_0172511844 /NCGR_PEP_ID=MMETSP1066-20121228/239675_1 /TAXON_ID=671091 /ORGANISM="Coscinodiscus wailesii, Strain CCMP2513" /LENGTH=155 /DNA_ID=CAMNT_0013291397 /DNA_START=274 /DNA_END=737 /DNA_ORIENTATION=-